jgi:hypothetical protein
MCEWECVKFIRGSYDNNEYFELEFIGGVRGYDIYGIDTEHGSECCDFKCSWSCDEATV